MPRRFCQAETAIFLVLWAALMVFGRSMLFRDPGTFWHTVAGEEMLQRGAVPTVDTWSCTRGGAAWTAHQWAGEVAMAVLHRLGGWDLLLLAAATLLAGLYAWLAGRLLRAGLHPLPALVLLALALLAGAPQFHVRPLIVTLPLFGVLFALLVDVESGRARLRRLAWLPPLAVVWTNLHAGVLAGLGTLGLVAAGWCLLWLWGTGRPPLRRRRDAAGLAAVVLLGGAAVLVNPYGVGLPKSWFDTLAVPLPQLIQEHGRLDLRTPLGWTALALGIGYVAALLSVSPRRWRVTWLVPLVWYILAVDRVRNLPLFAVAALLALADLLPATRLATWLAAREMFQPPAGDRPRRFDPRAAVAPLLAVALGACLPTAGDWVRFDPARWPVELLPELETLDRDSPEGTPIFNDLKYGGFLIYYVPRLRVFVDDRCALYGADFLTAYDRARRGHPETIDRWQAAYGFGHALVEPGHPFDRYLSASPDWRPVKRTAAAVLYERVESASSANASATRQAPHSTSRERSSPATRGSSQIFR